MIHSLDINIESFKHTSIMIYLHNQLIIHCHASLSCIAYQDPVVALHIYLYLQAR